MSAKKNIFTAPVIGLILLSFILGTSEFIVVGILPDIAADLNVSLAETGTLVSVFALAYSLGTPLVTACTGRANRYRLLLLMNILFIIGNLASGLAASYSFLVFSRIVSAVVAGTLISLSMTFSGGIAAPGNQGTVVAWIFSGFSIASIVGVPAGTLLSHWLGWRTAFLAIAAISLGVVLFLAHCLPRQGMQPQSSGLAQQLALLRDIRIQLGFLLPLFGAAAYYVFYTYLTPILETALAVPRPYLSGALLLFGICQIFSNLLSGKIAAAGGTKRLPAVFMLQTLLLAVLPLSFSFSPAGLAVLFALGLLMYLMNSPNQLHFLNTATRDYPGSVNLASALNPVAFNLGITLGSLTGSLIVAHMGLVQLGWFGALFSFAAFYAAFCLNRQEHSSRQPRLGHL